MCKIEYLCNYALVYNLLMATQFSTAKCYPLSIVIVNIANKGFPISAHCRTLIKFLEFLCMSNPQL